MKRRKYEKWIGYCFWDNERRCGVILEDLGYYEDGRNCYFMSQENKDGTYTNYICDFAKFKQIWNGTCLPTKQSKARNRKMNVYNILVLDGQVVSHKMFDEILEHEAVKHVEDNGYSGQHIGKRWYSVTFYDETFKEVQIYS